MGLVHQFTSGKAAATDATVVDGPDWDANHYFTGGNLGALLYQGTAGLVTGINSVASGQVLSSAGAGSVPAWTASPTLTSIIFSGASVLEGSTANVIEQRNGTTAQTWRLFNTWANSGTDNEKIRIAFEGNVGRIVIDQGGTGTIRNLEIGSAGASDVLFKTANTNRWAVNSSGHFMAVTDNTYDIGANGATRPRNIFVAGEAIIQSASGAGIKIGATADGVGLLRDFAGTSFSRLQFGGTTSSFPALKRSSTTLQVRLADDSGDAGFQAGAIGVAVSVPSAGQIAASGLIIAASATATPAGGSSSAGIAIGSSNVGHYIGTGAPSLSAAKGSIYVRTDATTTTTRMYINTDGGTTWTNFTTAA